MSEDTTTTVRLKRTGHDPVEIEKEQVSPTSLARIFSLDPATVWMREEYGSRIFFPDATNTHFELPVNAECLIVEGAATVQGPSSASSGVQVVTPVTTGYTSGNRPIFSSNQKKSQTFNVKVVQASLKWLPNGRPEFKQMGQIFVDITEDTANVQYVQCVVQSRWGPDYILVTVDGLQLDDSPGTKGFKFWKAGNRKLFAVKQHKGKGRIRKLSDDEDDDFEPLSKRHCGGSKAILREISQIKENLASVFKLSARTKTKLPLGLVRHLSETFRCHICNSVPMKPPIIYARCCKRILGCQVCVDKWFRGDDNESTRRSCPLCRGERAYADTSIIKGLDDFLIAINPLMSEEDNGEGSSEDELPAVHL